MSFRVSAIVAMDDGRVIGAAGKLPWNIPEDLRRFSSLTKGHTVLMGRKTYESLPAKFRPLPERLNVVLSRGDFKPDHQAVIVVKDLEDFIRACRCGHQKLQGDTLWIIGGAEIYKLTKPYWDELYLTQVHSKHTGDAFFPEFQDDFVLKEEEAHDAFTFQHYLRKPASD